MQVHVDSVTDVKTGQYGVSSKIVSGRDHYFVNDDATPYVGKDLEMEISEKTSAKGNKYKIGKILGVVSSANGASNGTTTWSSNSGPVLKWADYYQMAKEAHELAKELEPDHLKQIDGEYVGVEVDRSSARVALVNTFLIAFTAGKISLPEGEESPF